VAAIKACPYLGAGCYVGGEDVVGVPVEVLAGSDAAHGGARVGVPGRDLDVAEIDTGVKHRGHVGVAHILGSYVLSGRPSTHDNPSFRYREDVLRNQLYGKAKGAVDSVCRPAFLRPVNPPTPFDLKEAIDGLMYAEYNLDNRDMRPLHNRARTAMCGSWWQAERLYQEAVALAAKWPGNARTPRNWPARCWVGCSTSGAKLMPPSGSSKSATSSAPKVASPTS
jgi:hypothetical protein